MAKQAVAGFWLMSAQGRREGGCRKSSLVKENTPQASAKAVRGVAVR